MDTLIAPPRSPWPRLAGYALTLVAALLAAVSAYLLSVSSSVWALLGHGSASFAVAAGVFLLQLRCGSLAAAKVALGALLVVGFLPGAGLLGVLFVAMPSWLAEAPPGALRSIERPMPSFCPQLLHEAPLPRPPSNEALSPDRPLEERVAAVRSLRRMESARAVPLLRTALADPCEEVRLLAHALLDRRERTLRAKLESALHEETHLEAQSQPASASLHAKLAGLFWELAYAGFVQGTNADHALENAAQYALKSCRAPGQHGSVLIAIRALLRTGQLTRASLAIGWAERAGLPRVALAPLAAELAFLDRRFDRIDELLAEIARPWSGKPELAQMVQFWAQRRHAS